MASCAVREPTSEEFVDAVAALRLEHAHAHAFDLGEPRLDHARVVGPCLDQNFFGHRGLETAPLTRARLDRHRRLLVARGAQGER